MLAPMPTNQNPLLNPAIQRDIVALVTAVVALLRAFGVI